jgi:methylenetetrahydrofolate reductase (NADPH)
MRDFISKIIKALLSYRMIQFCKTRVPNEILQALEPIKADDEEVRKFGIEYGIKQC